MTDDWDGLARALRDARNNLRLTQQALADLAGVGIGTVKNLEGRRTTTRWPLSIAKIEKALGKPEGWARAIVEGRASAEDSLTAALGSEPPLRGLPASIRASLDGELLGADVIEFGRPGEKFRVTIIATRGAFQTEDDLERLRGEIESWMRLQAGVRRLAAESDDPPEVGSG